MKAQKWVIALIAVVLNPLFSVWVNAIDEGSVDQGTGIEAGLRAAAEGKYNEAFNTFRRLANQENNTARFYLGLMYDENKGINDDEKDVRQCLAFFWYQKAAERGNSFARNNLGIMYEEGREDVPKRDYVLAAYWYQKAAKQGNSFARANLGALYAKGRGIPQDFSLAYMWLNLAAAQGHSEAAIARDQLTGRMTLKQIETGQELSRKQAEASRPISFENPSNKEESEETIAECQGGQKINKIAVKPIGPIEFQAGMNMERPLFIVGGRRPYNYSVEDPLGARKSLDIIQGDLLPNEIVVRAEKDSQPGIYNINISDAAGHSITVSVIVHRTTCEDVSLSSYEKSLSTEEIKKIQAILGVEVDGDIGPTTRSAIKNFQRTAGVEETCQISEENLNSLTGVR